MPILKNIVSMETTIQLISLRANMKPEIIAIICIYLGFALVESLKTGLFNKKGSSRDDLIVEIVSIFGLLLIIQPGIILAAQTLAAVSFPEYAGVLKDLPTWVQFALLLIFDDLTQYWWHRSSHSIRWLYQLHRPHHNASYMSVRLVYRNSLLYYMLMPGIWLSAILVYLGLGWVYTIYITTKLTVIIGAHCDWHWDTPLYKIKALRPIMWVVERLISTPSTHSMHHGKHLSDGITHYKGNYGNLLFLWDIIFGSARITRRRPPKYGVEKLPETSWVEQLFWPFIRVSPEKNDTS